MGQLFNRYERRLTHNRLISISLSALLFLTCSNISSANAQHYIRLSHELIWKPAFSPDGNKIVTMDGKTLHVTDVKSGKELLVLNGHEFDIYAVAFSPDGTRLISGDGNCLRLWDAQTGSHLLRIEGRNGNLSSLAITPDGGLAVSGHSYGAGVEQNPPLDLFLWDLKTGKMVPKHRLMEKEAYLEVCRLEAQKSVNCVAISPDGKRVICGRKDGTARILEIATGKGICTLSHKAASVQGVAFSPDGERALVANEVGDICLWDVLRKTEERRLIGHKGAVYSVAFSPNGSLALSGGLDQTVRLWNLQTGKELACCHESKEPISTVAFAPDGRYAHFADQVGKYERWKLPE
ncbi:MAG TPA: WD40 repeat domain-containing protein [Gemmataceae bacterium]|jgi:WD40 repeat protein|nr:WD40 repeat domain-containing protein [Gemmataceae bacterium]